MELTELRDGATEDALGSRRDRDHHHVVGIGVVLDDEDDAPVEVSTPTTVSGTPFDVDGLTDGSTPLEELGRRGGAQDGDGRVVRDVLIVDEASLGQACGPRTFSQVGVVPCTEVVPGAGRRRSGPPRRRT